MFVVPFRFNAPAIVGCVTMIGTGEMISTMAAVALALTSKEDSPTNLVNVILTGLVTVTRRR